MSGILAYALHYGDEVNKNSLGAVSEAARLAREIGGEAHAVVVGESVGDELCQSLGAYGASKVFRAEAPEGLAQPVVDVMAKLIQDHGHSYALFGGGLLGFEIGAGLTARPILQDSAVVDSGYVGEPGIIIGRLNAFEADASANGASAEVEDVPVDL